MTSTDPWTQPEGPFDLIKGDDGRWSARDLAPLGGYARWENFDEACQRGLIAMTNTFGISAAQANIREATKVTERVRSDGRSTGTVEVADYSLSRLGAYFVLMNGDPRKPEIAAAQAYFAISTLALEDWYERISREHATEASDFARTFGRLYLSGKRRHVPGVTYVPTDAPGEMKVGATEQLDLVTATVSRLRDLPSEGRILRLIPGGHTRELLLRAELEPWRIRNKVDRFAMTPESLAVVRAHPRSRLTHQITDAYNDSLSRHPRKATAA